MEQTVMEPTELSLIGLGERPSSLSQSEAMHGPPSVSLPPTGNPSNYLKKNSRYSKNGAEAILRGSVDEMEATTSSDGYASSRLSSESSYGCTLQGSSSSDPLVAGDVETPPSAFEFGDMKGGVSQESGSTVSESDSMSSCESSSHSTSSSATSSIDSDDSSEYSDSTSCISFDEDLATSLSTFLSATSNQRRHTVPTAKESEQAEPPAKRSVSFADSDSGIDTLDENQMSAIKEDLMKVGNMFASQQCEGFRERARVLASINYLSRHVPSCVLDHLGREIRCGQPHSEPVYQQTKTLNQPISSADDTEGDWDCSSAADDSDCPSSFCRRHSDPSVFSAGSQEGVILGLPYVAPFSGAVLFVDIAGFTSLSARVGSENISRLINDYFDALISVIFSFDGDIQKFSGDAFFAEWRVTSSRKIDECAKLATLCTCKIARDFYDYPVKASKDAGVDGDVVKLNSHFGLGIGDMNGIHIGDSGHRRQYLQYVISVHVRIGLTTFAKSIGSPIIQATSACNLADSGEIVVSSEFYEVVLNTEIHEDILLTRNQQKILMREREGKLDRCLEQLIRRSGGNARSRAITEHVEGLELHHMKEYQRLISLYCHPVEQAGLASFETMPNMNKESVICEPEMRDVFVAFVNAPLTLHQASGVGFVNDDIVYKINRVFNSVSCELIHSNGYLESFIDDKGFSLMITFGLRGSWFPDLVSAVALPAILTIEETLSSEEDIKCHIGATFGNVHCGFLGSKQRHEYTVLGPSVNLAARLMTCEMNNCLLVDQSVRDSCGEAQAFESVGFIKAKGYSDEIMTYRPIAKELRDVRRAPEKGPFVGRHEELDQIIGRSNLLASSIVMIEGMPGLGKSSLLLKAASAIVGKNKSDYVLWEHIVGDAKLTSTPFGALEAFAKSIVFKLKSQVGAGKQVLDEVRRVIDFPVSSVDGEEYCPRKHRTRLIRASSRICQALTMMLDRFDRLIISIKDCHRLDAFTWRTLSMFLEANDRAILLGTTTTTALKGFRMDEETSDLIFGTFRRTDRLLTLKLDALPIQDVKQMVMAYLKMDFVQEELLHQIYAESGGRPLYVEKILQRLQSSGESDFCEDLIVDQLDRLRNESRHCLAVVACLGDQFSCEEVKRILEIQGMDGTHCSKTLDALAEGKILLANRKSVESEGVYSFLDDRWRKKLLEITPQSAQGEIKQLVANSD